MRANSTASLICLAAACEADEPEQVFELEGLTVAVHFSDPVCDGTLEYFARRLRWLEEQTGLQADDRPLRYEWYREDSPNSYCRSEVAGCAIDSTFYGPLLLFGHELVHGLLSQRGDVRPWLAEGLAELLDDDLVDPPFTPTAPTTLLEAEAAWGLDYFSSAAFAGYLRQRYGLARLLEFYAAVDGADVDASREIFGEVFGESWEAIEADYLDNYDLGRPLGTLDCAAPTVGWGDTLRWEHRFTEGCEGEHSVGPFDLPPAGTSPEPWFEDAVTLRIGSPGLFRFATTGLAESFTVVARSCTSPGAIVLWPGEPVSEYEWFDAGIVRVSLRAPLDAVPDVRVILTRYPDMVAER